MRCAASGPINAFGCQTFRELAHQRLCRQGKFALFRPIGVYSFASEVLSHLSDRCPGMSVAWHNNTEKTAMNSANDTASSPAGRWLDRNRHWVGPSAALLVITLSAAYGPSRLGPGASGWMQGQLRHEPTLEQPARARDVLHLADQQLQAGRYTYKGAVQIDGDLNTSGFRLRAGEISVTGSVIGHDISLRAGRIAVGGRVDGKDISLNTTQAGGYTRIEGDRFRVSYGGPVAVQGGVFGQDNSIRGGRVQIGGDIAGTDLMVEGRLPQSQTRISVAATHVNIDHGLFAPKDMTPAVQIGGRVTGANIEISANAGVQLAGYDPAEVTVTTGSDRPVTVASLAAGAVQSRPVRKL